VNRTLLVALLLVLPFALAKSFAQEEPAFDDRLLTYLSSTVPEQQQKAEKIIQACAVEFYEHLEKKLPDLKSTGRERLLRILAATEHERRIPLCMKVLSNGDARRAERILASTALRQVEGDKLLQRIEEQLVAPDLAPYNRMQLCSLLGTLSSARAQGVAEKLLEGATPGSLAGFAAEDAALRSTLDSTFAQPAWARYQERHTDAPKVTLRALQSALDDLALPRAADRAAAEEKLRELIGNDERVLLALCRSHWPERAGFALRRLKTDPPRRLQVATHVVVLDLALTGEQAVALLAMELGIASRPPTASEMEDVRQSVSRDAIARIEAILEAMGHRGDLAELRLKNERLVAKLRPLLLRRGPADDEVRAVQAELQGVRQRLDVLEKAWELGWRREFETEILSPRSN
jgi:hypothetical protein